MENPKKILTDFLCNLRRKSLKERIKIEKKDLQDKQEEQVLGAEQVPQFGSPEQSGSEQLVPL